jgi:hypothetical protein
MGKKIRFLYRPWLQFRNLRNFSYGHDINLLNFKNLLSRNNCFDVLRWCREAAKSNTIKLRVFSDTSYVVEIDRRIITNVFASHIRELE